MYNNALSRKFKIILCATLFFCIHNFPTTASAQSKKDESVSAQIEKLNQRIKELESLVKKGQEISHKKSMSDSLDNLALKKEVADVLRKKTEKASTRKTLRTREQNTNFPVSSTMNPGISVIGSFLGTGNNIDHLDRNYGIGLDATEFAFRAAVDPYATADFFVAVHKHKDPLVAFHDEDHDDLDEHDDHGLEEDGHEDLDPHGHGENPLEFELEEAFVTLLNMPFGTQVKAGKFRTKFGKLNETHPHAYNILDLPIMYQNFISRDGFIDQGVSVRWLLPHSAFFQELTFQVTDGPAGNASFARGDKNEFVYNAHLKNYFDLSDNLSLEAGLGMISGQNAEKSGSAQIWAGDITIKWKPLQRNRYKSFEWTTEFMQSRQNHGIESINSIGWFSHMRYQTQKRIFLGVMAEYSEFPEFNTYNQKAYSGIIQFLATEFQKFEFQGRYNKGNFFESFYDFSLRAVFVIGAHGAHQY